MIIRVEPKDWNMYAVIMFFKKERPHTEDADIRRYLAEHRLQPKRQYDTELEGEAFEVMTFGGCYLGRHMSALADIQRGVVERELLAEAIPALLTSGPDAAARALAADLTDAQRREYAAALTDALHAPANFGVDAGGELQATPDAADVQARFLALTADSECGAQTRQRTYNSAT